MKRYTTAVNTQNRDINWKTITGVLGAFTLFIGIALLMPIGIALFYGESTWPGFLIAGGLAIGLGGLAFLNFKPSDNASVQIRDAFILVSSTWVILSLFGALPYYIDGTLVTYTDAFFETMSGLTTTGATILGGETAEGLRNPDIDAMPKSILFWRSLTHWLGGMGFIVLSIAILPLLGTGGMQLFSAESSLLSSDKVTPRFRETARFLWLIYLGLTILHFLLLWISPEMDWFEAINHAFSTLATGGFSTHNASVGGYDSVYIDAVITLFMFLAGVNFVLYFRMIRGEYRISLTNPELIFYAVATLACISVITLGLWLQTGYTPAEALRYGSFQAVSILTTTGYGTDDYLLWSSLPLIVIAILFFTGASTGSTSGGIKMIRWLIIFNDILLELRQRVHPRAVLPLKVGGSTIAPQQPRTILAFLLFYIFIFLVGAVLLSAMGFDMASAFGASIASLGNIGPAFGIFGPSDNYAIVPQAGKWLLSFMMLIGRLELFTVLILFTPDFWKS
jgi:trk system potassium uptake protein TrkH